MRIFNANVGDESTGNAGPDAIEQDLDNLYRYKADKTEVLTKNNTTEYIPTHDYHPTTKKYTDIKATETTQAINSSLNLINEDISELDIGKANTNNVLGLDNETEYVPLSDYNPATKKYVDDEVELLGERITSHYVTGTYVGNGTDSNITLSFQPCMVVIQNSTSPITYTIIDGYECKDEIATLGQITETGFTASDVLNTDTINYNYIAFK